MPQLESPMASPCVIEPVGSPTCDVLLAKELNERAGILYKEAMFEAAVELYTVAMRSADAHKVGLHVLYSNRSAALLRSAQTKRAIEDAREACALAPASPKVWGRLGTALFYAHEYLPACAAYRQKFALEPDSSSKRNLLSAICALPCWQAATSGGGGGPSEAHLEELLLCAQIPDRFVHLSALLQLAGLAQWDGVKAAFMKRGMALVLKYGSLRDAELDLHCCPRGCLPTAAPATAALYAAKLGAAYDATHPLTVAAAALSNFTVSSGGDSGSTHPAALMLRDRDMLEGLYKLAGDTCWCRKAQFHVAVAYRSVVQIISSGGTTEMMAAIDGSVPEGLSILIRNAKENGWSSEEARLHVMLNAVLMHRSHPGQQVPEA
eukprot:jgi/Tetstr1/448773/TSEL_036008.t1